METATRQAPVTARRAHPEGPEAFVSGAPGAGAQSDSFVSEKRMFDPPRDELGRSLAAAVSRRAVDPQRAGGYPLPRRILARVDQHADTHVPNADELAKIDALINPTAPPVPGGVEPAWTGTTTEPGYQGNRDRLRDSLWDALGKYLDAIMDEINLLATDPKLPMSAFEGPGRAAKRVVDKRFGAYASAAALTAPQVHVRDTFAFIPGVQLLDRSNPADFTPDPADLAGWIAQTDPTAAQLQHDEHFNKDRSNEEYRWLVDEVLTPFVNVPQNSADLQLYDIYGFASSEPGTVRIAPSLTDTVQFPAAAPTGGGPSPAERFKRWGMWRTLVHEYIHTLEHPAFLAARGANRILFEGFCEMFTEEVLRIWIPIARMDTDFQLRRDVEGTTSRGDLWPGFYPGYIPDYDAGQYADYAERAKELRKVLGKGGENAARAAFFQGHIELIGLAPDGRVAAPPTGAGARRGTRFHYVVASGATVETAAQIATQNGITVSELEKANPGLDLAALAAGDVVSIPVRDGR